jgi:hypothetical protein
MQNFLMRLRRAPHASMVFLALMLIALTFLDAGVDWFALRGTFTWQVVSGSLLLTLLIFQWVLFFKRSLNGVVITGQDVKHHRWVGVAATYVFALHAVRLGHAWMTGLSILFFLLALTGVLNRQVLGYRQNWLYLLWLITHIGISAAMIPLIGVHIWVALAYE